MGMRYYQRVGKGSGVSMPIWMLPFWLLGVLVFYVGAAIGAAVFWLLYQLLRSVGVGGAAAIRSRRDQRERAAAEAANPALRELQERNARRAEAADRRRAGIKREAREAIPNLLPASWLLRIVVAGWCLLWIGAGVAGVWTALTSPGHSVAGPMLGPTFLLLVTVVTPMFTARAIRRRRWAAPRLAVSAPAVVVDGADRGVEATPLPAVAAHEIPGLTTMAVERGLMASPPDSTLIERLLARIPPATPVYALQSGARLRGGAPGLRRGRKGLVAVTADGLTYVTDRSQEEIPRDQVVRVAETAGGKVVDVVLLDGTTQKFVFRDRGGAAVAKALRRRPDGRLVTTDEATAATGAETARQPPQCPACGAPQPPNGRFCTSCGAPIHPHGDDPDRRGGAEPAPDTESIDPEPLIPYPQSCTTPDEQERWRESVTLAQKLLGPGPQPGTVHSVAVNIYNSDMPTG